MFALVLFAALAPAQCGPLGCPAPAAGVRSARPAAPGAACAPARPGVFARVRDRLAARRGR